MKDPNNMTASEIDTELKDLEKFFRALYDRSTERRSHTVTVRLKVRTAYFARIVANEQGRTLSRWIEQAIERQLSEVANRK